MTPPHSAHPQVRLALELARARLPPERNPPRHPMASRSNFLPGPRPHARRPLPKASSQAAISTESSQGSTCGRYHDALLDRLYKQAALRGTSVGGGRVAPLNRFSGAGAGGLARRELSPDEPRSERPAADS